MNFMEKLYITLSLRCYRYSPYVDDFIKKLISEGEFVAYDRYRAEIKWRGVHYGVWIESYPHADLTNVKRYSDNATFYKELRPSRATQIAFWKWMNKQGVYPGSNPSDPQEKNVKALLIGIKDGEKEPCSKN